MKHLTFYDLVSYQQKKQNQPFEDHLKTCLKCRKKVEEFEKLSTFLKMSGAVRSGPKSNSCFDDLHLLEYLEARQDKKIQKAYLAHLSQCDSCLSRLIAIEGMLNELKIEGLVPTSETFWGKIGSIIEVVTSKIKKKFGITWGKVHSPRPVYKWAIMAAIIIVICLVVPQQLKENNDPLTTRETTVENNIRLFSPENKSIIRKSSQLEFKWTEIKKITSYNFLLLDENGNIIYEVSTEQTTLKLPGNIILRPSITYFWQVEAVLDFGNSIQSEMAKFIYHPN
ncbi:hypothetical protein H8E88_29760 [candidate division KSB1 bacterium]|nr:hypothetical protein [candidate division KSB1 bacterium]MBL7093793.1 hypothetical protein [candidate division KSB1 bacterium]